MPKVTLDGKTVNVPTNATVLDAAHKAGIWIPTLCHHAALTPSASCRLCMVELDRGDWSQMITACNYPVRRDIVVRVSSERAVRARQGVMRLLLARAPENETLIALARRMGVEDTPFPTVTSAQRDCILCGLCTRVCEEILGRSAIGFAGRGPERAVTPPLRLPAEDCIGCGACAEICPVGTIQLRIHEDTDEVEIAPFKTRVKLMRCSECGARLGTIREWETVVQRCRLEGDDFRRRLRLCPACRRRLTGSQAVRVETFRASDDRQQDPLNVPIRQEKTHVT